MTRILTILLASIIYFSCSKDKEVVNEEPKENNSFQITTNEISNVTVNTALLTGSLKIEGNVQVQEVGFCWNVDPMPTTIHQKKSIESLKGTYENQTLDLSFDVEGLFEGTQYYVRAYAIVDGVIHYGQEKSFNTLVIEGIKQFWSIEGAFNYQNLTYLYDTSTKVLAVSDMNEISNLLLFKFLGNIEPDRSYDLVNLTKEVSNTQATCAVLMNGESWSIPESKKFTLSTFSVEDKIILRFNDIELVNDQNVLKKSSALIVLQ